MNGALLYSEKLEESWVLTYSKAYPPEKHFGSTEISLTCNGKTLSDLILLFGTVSVSRYEPDRENESLPKVEQLVRSGPVCLW